MSGALYVVATPIGNLQDITFRALEILRKVDLIVAEDTRTSRKLLCHYNIRKPVYAFYDDTRKDRIDKIIQKIKEGNNVALISESGTPGISDPGAGLVNEAHAQKLKVYCIPGASAVVSAVSVSGLGGGKFIFEGFLPRKKSKRQKILKKLVSLKRSIVIFESPGRLMQTLEDIKQICPQAKVAIARELTKIFEEVIHGDIDYVISHFSKTTPKGEFTIVISPMSES